MSDRKITTVIFDLGGVLVDWNPRYVYRKIFKDEQKIESFLKDVCNSEWNEKQDAGRPFLEAVNELVLVHPELKAEISAYFERWEEMLGGSIEGTVKILEELKRRGEYRLLGLSNWSGETFPIAKRRFPFLGLFENILVSGDEKLIKPDAKFFKLLETRFGVVPSEAVFIDDVQKNIDGAQRMGLKTIHFSTPENLRKELRERFHLNLDEK